MNRITSPIRWDDAGASVAVLQMALQEAVHRDAIPLDEQTRASLLERLGPEVAERTFRDATAELVARFQEQHQLDTIGEVDEPTAEALNRLLERWGLLDGDGTAARPDLPDTSYELRVTVSDARGAPIPGLTVGARNNAERAPSAALGGPAVTDAEGSVLLRFSRSSFISGEDPDGRGLSLGFAVSREDVPLAAEVVSGGVSRTDAGVRFEPTGLTVAADAAVTGKATYDGSLPARGLEIQVRNLRFGGDRDVLGSVTTDSKGAFALAYDPGTTAVNLEAVTPDPAAPDGAVALGETVYAAGLFHILTLIAPPPPELPEYSRLSADLAGQVGDLGRLAQAKESGERQDLTMLSRATGWDPRLIALAATSERLAAADGGPSLAGQTLYGLLRAGLPSDVETLVHVDDQTMAKALTLARDNGIVEMDDTGIAEATQQFRDFAASARLAARPPDSNVSYGDLLTTAGLTEEHRTAFANLAFARRGDPDHLWSDAQELGLPASQIGRLRLQGKFALLAGNSAPVTDHLLSLDVADPAELVERGLFGAAQWKQELTTLAGGDDAALEALIPASYEADTLADRVDLYAGDLARRLRMSYPTHVVTQLVGQGDVAVAAPAATVTLLKVATANGFVLGETPAETFFATMGAGAVGLGDEELVVAKQDVKELHRTYQLSPSNESMMVLTDLGLKSAYDITGLGESEFARVYEDRHVKLFGTKPAAPVSRLVYRKAQQISSTTYNLFAAAKTLAAQPGLPVTAPTAAVKQNAQTNLLKHFPTMEGLFGSIDYVECPHCRSVLSPAAYFVDILQFIDPDEPTWATFLSGWKDRHAGRDYTDRFVKPIDALQERRPDLFAIELTCENTLTALPYIDVVNEIFEYYVANGALTEDAARDTGSATTEELLAEPQNLLRLAYTKLVSAKHPDPLPFDLWLETVREFSAGLGIPLADVMEVFRDSDAMFDEAQDYDRADTFIERLGFSPAEAAILCDPAPLTEWWLLYGYATEADATTEAVDAETGQRLDLNSAKTLSRRLGVTYQELVDVIQTGFVNPARSALGLLYKLGVSIRAARHYTDHRSDPPPVTAVEWAERKEVEAFEARLTTFAASHNITLATLQDEVDALPYEHVLVLADPDSGANFDQTTLRYADGTSTDPMAFVRIAHFVRLWRKLGWTIEETDRALEAFVPADAPFAAASLDQRPLRSALIHLSHLATLSQRLELPERLRRRLATLWLDLPTVGDHSLYEQLFLTSSVLRRDPMFDHPRGRYLDWTGLAPTDVPTLSDHLSAVQAALGLTRHDVELILDDAALDANTPLDVSVLSTLHRYALLATMLKLDMRDLVTLKSLSGKDPFAALHPGALETLEQDHPYQQTLGFVDLARRVLDSGLTVADLDELLRDRRPVDVGDGPVADAILTQLKTLADGVRTIRADHTVPADAGSLSDDQLRQELGLVLDRDVVDTLLAMVQGTAEFATVTPSVLASAKHFFATHLRQQAIAADTSFGFLTDADFDLLIAPLPVIPHDLTAEEELAARRSVDDAVRAKRALLTTAFIPFLQRRLIRQLAVDTITAWAGAAPALVADLLTDRRLLGTAEPLLEAFEQLDDTIDLAGSELDGFVEVPASGLYLFSSVVEAAGAHTELRFGHLAQPSVLAGTAGAGPEEFSGTVELQAGRLYPFEYTNSGFDGGTARLFVQTATLARGSVARLILYPKATVIRASAALTLVGKVLRLVQALDLSHAEVRHLATNPGRFAGLALGDLPTADVGDGPDDRAAAIARFGWVSRLIDYAALKRRLGGSDELLEILLANDSADPDRLTTKVYPIVAGLTGQSTGTVAETAATIWPAGPSFDDERPVARLLDGVRIARDFGVPADTVASWTGIIRESDQRRFDIAGEVRDSIKATLEPAAWQRIAQPIFDRLRARQRDALVAFVARAIGVTTIEQLYEHFLIDPGMEPVVQTSRIRLATASVQQFIHRILLNLERTVPPETINAKQWEWMHRYRVWEANRKIFLYPENWLEPEFRDQKTHLFAELESTLLEGDASPDLVEDAFLTYLTKFEQIARLDIVASHLEDDLDTGTRTLHVFGRTFGAPHSYFYRRYAHGAWTPWEPVGLDIQGDHLVPVVWRDRLRLFWVTFRTVATEITSAEIVPTEKITIAPPKQSLIAELHWSDHLEGGWGEPHNGNADHTAGQSLTATENVAPRSVSITVAREAFTADGQERGVFVNLGYPFRRAFYLQGRNSAPVSAPLAGTWTSAYSASVVDGTRRGAAPDAPLTVSIERRKTEIGLAVTTKPETPTVLAPHGAYSVLEPDSAVGGLPPAVAGLIRPIFVQDAQYTLFGEAVVTERKVRDWEEWVTVPAPSGEVSKLPRYLDEITINPARPDLRSLERHGVHRRPHVGQREPAGGGRPDWLLNDVTGLAFDGVVIHPRAGTELVGLGRQRVVDSEILGSDVAAAVILAPELTDAPATAAQSIGLGIVGTSGASRAVLANTTAFEQLRGG